MEIVGDRKFVEIPGTDTLELPPLLVTEASPRRRLDRILDLAAKVVETEEWVPAQPGEDPVSSAERERRKMDMALNLVDLYLNLVRHWHWGDGIVEWIRQCEITFDMRSTLRPLLRPDVWPHAGRSSFVTLLEDKGIGRDDVGIERAVGLRLAFRQAPPISLCSDQFLFYLNGPLAMTAYQKWAAMSPEPVSSLPPERFTFQVVEM